MNYYIATLVFRINVEEETKAQFDEQVRLIESSGREEAFMKCKALGEAQEESFKSANGKMIEWKFINVSEIHQLSELKDGAELFSNTKEIDLNEDYTSIIHAKSDALGLRSESKLFHPSEIS